ncbi:D-alanyl-D-alanine carboxypeptidase [Levilactobacillus yiduensis]|uniref:D-alanyl-D-alanine carboxypeptidase n=1 Tax=Levilactobacillus yiduensis TaxID=2953880 RepID=UPI000EF2B31B|nr:D-alanyl-D-alanine carboxypeptidase [Levilactobacillus yiduensis]AYM04024.1 D-alanyl-D-alanine carboxypeptidase [Levilactobacillus brevis]
MKKMVCLTLLAATIGLSGLISAQATIKTNFTNIHYSEDLFEHGKFTDVAYHAKSRTKNTYIWNDTHTKKLYNLKSYPNYTWFKLGTATYKGNSHWMKVVNAVNSKTGWVYSPRLTKGFNPKGYQITRRSYAQPKYAGKTYHVTSAKKNAYLWNWTHTKKLLNLKHYTNQNLSQIHSVLVSHQGKTMWYYYTSVNTKKGDIRGYVRSDQVTLGKTTDHQGQNILYPDAFVTTKDYLQYINQSKYQKLARAIVKLFPNTPVDLGLSRIAAFNYATNDTWDEDPDEPVATTGYTDIVPFKTVAAYLMTHKSQTNAQKLAGVEKALNKAGYTKAKRAKLTNYRLGIYILNNVMGGKYDEAGDAHKGNWYGLIIGKTD